VVRERHLEERVAGAPIVADAREKLTCLAVILERLLIGVDRASRVSRFQQVLDRLLRNVRYLEVPRKKTIRLLRRLLIDVLERIADLVVELASLRLDEARVSDLLDEAVPEAVFRVRTPPHFDDEVEPLELGQRVDELVVLDEALEQRHAERPADDGGDVDDLARLRVEPIEAGL
jgi:hypothetical protein